MWLRWASQRRDLETRRCRRGWRGDTMTLRMVTMVLVLGGLLIGCGKHYWQAEKRGVAEFKADSGLFIQEAKTKYGVSETIYRGCMSTHSWRRVQTQNPTDLQ